jgi:hypothetical protein
MPYLCDRCGHSFARKDYLVKHFQRKTKCEPLSEDHDVDTAILLERLVGSDVPRDFICACGKAFANSNNLRFHRSKHCKMRNPDIVNHTAITSTPKSTPDDIIKSLQQQMVTLQAQVHKLTVNQETTTVNVIENQHQQFDQQYLLKPVSNCPI